MSISILNTASDSARLDKTGKTRLGSYTKIIVQMCACFLSSCPWGELSVGKNVRGAKCPWGELSTGRTVRGTNCPWGEMSWGELSWGELSWGEF